MADFEGCIPDDRLCRQASFRLSGRGSLYFAVASDDRRSLRTQHIAEQATERPTRSRDRIDFGQFGRRMTIEFRI